MQTVVQFVQQRLVPRTETLTNRMEALKHRMVDRKTGAEDRKTGAEDRKTGAEDRQTHAEDRQTHAEDREAAVRFVAQRMLGDRKEEEEEEEGDLCFNKLFTFISGLQDKQWENLRDQMREPLTQAHLAQVSRRIVTVVSELVLQVLVPVLMDQLQPGDPSEGPTCTSSVEEFLLESSGSSSSHTEECLGSGGVTSDECRYSDASDLESLHEFYCCCVPFVQEKLQSFPVRVREALKRIRNNEVAPQEATPDIGDASPPRDATRQKTFTHDEVLQELLTSSLMMLSSCCIQARVTSSEPYRETVLPLASKILEAVARGANQLFEGQREAEGSEDVTATEEQVAAAALLVTKELRDTIKDFFDNPKKDEDGEAGSSGFASVTRVEGRRESSEVAGSKDVEEMVQFLLDEAQGKTKDGPRETVDVPAVSV
ncbi:hypothetical protein CgunFtcFv8_017177 [Champsocephalus gunnari]|uniref:Uncharacterized protein n=1 Tax=Champsocephalus gunnari TaxID=52237 RepID=A0AAN8HQ49_CHAGU|nr:hypothetical protein CgunFtcFv8_017177 [Champsocephalus gunnari]